MKKIFFLWLCVFFTVMACSQGQHENGYVLKGDIKGIGVNLVYLRGNTPDGFWVDSVTANHGEFIFKGQVKEPGMFTLTVEGEKGYINIILENTEIFVVGIWDSIPEVTVSGSKENELYKCYLQKIDPLQNELSDLFEIYGVARTQNDTIILNLINDKTNKLFKQQLNITRQFIINHPKAYASALAFNRFYRSLSPEEAKTLFAKIDPTVRSYVNIRDFPEMVEAKKNTEIGKPAIDFTLPNSKGQLVNLSSIQGDYKYVLLDFWASWCLPCRAENPNIKKAYQMFHDEGFEIVAVSLDDEKEKWIKAINEDGLPWIHVSDLKVPNEVAKMYGVEGVPTNFLIGPDGKIVAKRLHGERLIKKLQEVFNKS